MLNLAISLIQLVAGVLTIAGAIVAALFGLWYWGLDRKTEQYGEDLRHDIEDDDSFSGIRGAAEPRIVATSDSKFSKTIGNAKDLLGRSEKPSKIVVMENQELPRRKIEMIRERVRYIPGRNILQRDLVGAIRNYYAVQLALKREDVGSNVVEYFQDSLRQYEHSEKVSELGNPEKYGEITLANDANSESGQDPLNDVFLPLVGATERYCVAPISDVQNQYREIEDCRAFLMFTFWGLWAERAKGLKICEDGAEDEYTVAYREDIRDNDNWGYWMLPEGKCSNSEFRRVRHLAWTLEDIINEYWSGEPYNTLFPQGDSIREMDEVDRPFVIFQKDEQVVRGGASPT